MNDIHIGSVIKQKLEESSLTIKEFAGRINCERSTVYHIFKQRSIDIEKLIKISEVLNYDFITEVYLKPKDRNTPPPPHTLFVAVEVDVDSLQQVTLPDGFISLMKK